MSSRTPEQLLTRLNRLYEDELQNDSDVDVELIIRDHGYNWKRLSIVPDDHSWRSDIGPAFETDAELVAFMNGLEKAAMNEIDVKSETSVLSTL